MLEVTKARYDLGRVDILTTLVLDCPLLSPDVSLYFQKNWIQIDNPFRYMPRKSSGNTPFRQ